MSDLCSTHPDRPATGRCARCARSTCSLCTVEVGDRLYCSIICFTEQALAAKGKALKTKRKDPLAETLTPPAPTAHDEPSVVVRAVDAAPSEETSLLDLSSLKRPSASEESTVVPVEGRMKEPTSILNMAGIAKAPDGSWLEEPPGTDTPLPILLPGTRRSTIPSECVFHGDTPAVVRCSLCGDPICTLCIADEEHGGRCSPICRRDRRPSGRGRKIAVLAVVATTAVLAWLFRPGRETPPPPVRPLAESIGNAEAEARAAEAERLRLEAEAREEARRRVAAREKEEADARAKAEAEAKEAALKAAAEAKAAAVEAVAKAEADAKEALAKAEALAAAEAAAKAAREKEEADARAKAAAEARAKAEADARAKEEARAAAEARARAEALEKEKAEAAAKALALDASLRKAAGLLREATPAFGALADQAAADPVDPRALVPGIDAVAGRLSAARTEYAAILHDAANRSTLERRIAILEELLAALREFRARCVESR